MTFHDLRLSKPIVRAVEAEGYSEPTPIQAQAIPPALEGRDVLGCAQTGTGKTGAFALPILHRLAGSEVRQPKPSRKRAQGRLPRAIVLCPTRELAMQILDSFATYGRELTLQHAVVYGGVSQYHQVKALRAGVDVLVATPGRLLDLVNQGHVDLANIETIVLDEADRMLDMGFINDISKVIELLPDEHQTLFFSATMSKEIRSLADSILLDPVSIQTNPESSTVKTITQHLYKVDRAQKQQLLRGFLRSESVERALVFTKTKHGADRLARFLRRSSINADAIHGNKTQNMRTKAMDAFRRGRTSVLIATDVASRGIDVDNITHVINYDMPIDPETYVHRIGRTARAGASGIAVSFCCRDEKKLLRAVERRTDASFQSMENEALLKAGASEADASESRNDGTYEPRDREPRDRRGPDLKSNFKSNSKPKSKSKSKSKSNFKSNDAQKEDFGGFKPKSRTGGWKVRPQESTGDQSSPVPYQPKGNTGDFKPKSKPGGWKPKPYGTRDGDGDGYKPKGKGGGYKPKSKSGGWKPKPYGTRDGDGDGYKSKGKGGGYKPKSKSGGWKPKPYGTRDGDGDGYKSKGKGGGYKPKSKSGGWKPKPKSGGFKSKPKSGGWKPRASDGSASARDGRKPRRESGFGARRSGRPASGVPRHHERTGRVKVRRNKPGPRTS